MRLAELQRQFALSLLGKSHSLIEHIESSIFSGDERLQIYRNNFNSSLIDVLAMTYPMILALIGEHCFHHLARVHIQRNPPTQGSVDCYGEHFDVTLTSFPELTKAVPYAPDVARFEWQIDKARQAHDYTQPSSSWRPLAQLSSVPVSDHDKVCFQLPLGAQFWVSEYAVATLREGILSGRVDNIDFNQAESGIAFVDTDPIAQKHVLVATALSSIEYQLADSLHQGLSIGAIAEPLLTSLESLIQQRIVLGFRLNSHSLSNKE
ncbi:DUF2063 domain-containing protein [Vibrio sp. SM6]|uniref:DUF2063 domain-containing protein n=1 Tax=Vibrio agarilyticus TaxID=2726741 RepID=A0A7X8TTX3_9VIBR|nr:DNA-binding domain-containing protein [Vibrio agarilyticus]NLS14789.1 DUF2063 domain-containing protein [Vibrio agarilyticus]